MKIKLTPSTKPLLDAVLRNIVLDVKGNFKNSGFKKLGEMGISIEDFQMFITEDGTEIFSEDKLQYLFKELNLYNYIISKWKYKDLIYN